MRENQHRNGASAVLCRTSVCVSSHECTVGTIYSHVITINSAQVKTARSCRLHKIMPRAVGRYVADHAAVSRLRSSARGAPLHRSNFLVEMRSFRETQLAGRVTLWITRPAACAPAPLPLQRCHNDLLFPRHGRQRAGVHTFQPLYPTPQRIRATTFIQPRAQLAWARQEPQTPLNGRIAKAPIVNPGHVQDTR